MNELVVFDPVKAELAEYKELNASLVFDYEDPQGNKDARSHIYKLRQAKTKIADIHKVAKAEAWGICCLLDGEKKKLTAQVDEWIDVHHKPIKEIEERTAKVAAEKANAERLEAIRIEAERAAETERREKELAEREAAAQAKEDELAREKERLEAAKQAEIDKQAALKEAREQAEREKQAAVEAEKERQRKEAEAAQAEKDRLAEVKQKRVEDESHRTAIEAEVALAVTEICSIAEELGQDIGDALITALIDDEIPHVKVIY